MPWNWKVWRVVMRREGDANFSESSSRTSHCWGRGLAAGQADAEHEGESFLLAGFLQDVALVAVVLQVDAVELGELGAFLADGAGGGVGQILGDAAAEVAGDGLDGFVGGDGLFGGRMGMHRRERIMPQRVARVNL